jgi:hypothetical protein
MPTPQRAPRIKSNHELRRTQQRLGTAGLIKLNMSKHSLGTVPSPAQSKLREADVQTRLCTDKALECGAMLRHSCQCQFVREDNEGEDGAHAQGAQQGNPQPAL